MESDYYLPLIGALVVVRVAHSAITEPHTVKGPLKFALGTLTGVFYYLVLGGGIVLLLIGLQSSFAGSISTSITLLVTLALLEASAGPRALQGPFEYREASRLLPPAGPSPTPASPLVTRRVCPNCGTELRPTARFCTRCGAKMP